MTSLTPRPPYTSDELNKLYPKNLELELVQVLLRHGERSPVSARFQNAGLRPYWPYCHAAQRLRSVIQSPEDDVEWNSLQWRRRLESFGADDRPIIATGPHGEVDGVCQLGELTDRGRETTYALGTRLRHLYVKQLGFMPALIADADMIYLRATPLPRALESVQQTFWGMYPLSSRTATFPAPTIVTRTPADETLYPNEGNCRRFAQLARAFAQRAADRWNESADMDYVNDRLTKWMPEASKKVAVDSHPRISGIMDTINSTLAHGPETRLPREFYDAKLRKIIEKVGVEEWFAGYTENREYRTLGIGALAGDIVERITAVTESSRSTVAEIGGEDGHLGTGRGGETGIKFALSGCHDTTLGGLLSALGAFETEPWPPYTSHIAVELFKEKATQATEDVGSRPLPAASTGEIHHGTSQRGWFASMLGFGSSSDFKSTLSAPDSNSRLGRRPYTSLSESERSNLAGRYVRVRYNDRAVTIPACKEPGNHLHGDQTFCTLEAFKRVVDGFTPKNWKLECTSNLEKEITGVKSRINEREPAGYIEEGC